MQGRLIGGKPWRALTAEALKGPLSEALQRQQQQSTVTTKAANRAAVHGTKLPIPKTIDEEEAAEDIEKGKNEKEEKREELEKAVNSKVGHSHQLQDPPLSPLK